MTTTTYSYKRELNKAYRLGYQKPTMSVARHVALATVTIPFEEMPEETVIECVAEGDERFEAGNPFGLAAGTTFYLVACKSVMSGRIFQTFLNRYYVVVERNGKLVASNGKSSPELATKAIAQVERFIAAQQTVEEEEAVEVVMSEPVQVANEYLAKALAMIAATRPAWQGERVRVA